MEIEALKADLRRHEGLRLHPYVDTVGKVTIGYGHNLTDLGISKETAEDWLDFDARGAVSDCERLVPHFFDLDEPRQRVLVNMAFNLGIVGLLKFKNMLSACAVGDWATAKLAGLDSTWAKQVGHRADELMQRLFTGE